MPRHSRAVYRPMRIRQISLLAAALLLAACEDPAVPEGVAGRYELNTIDGERLPAWANGTGVEGVGRELRSGTLRLREPDQLELVLKSRLVDADGDVTQTMADTLRGTWREDGGGLHLNVQGGGLYWVGPGAAVASNRRIDAVLHWMAPAYTGYASVAAAATFTR
jgi:hypothetical protein